MIRRLISRFTGGASGAGHRRGAAGAGGRGGSTGARIGAKVERLLRRRMGA